MVGSVVPDTDNDIAVETPTGTAVQYKSFHVAFTLDFDIDGVANKVLSSDEVHIRLRRIAATANEISGEVVVTHIGIVIHRDKLGEAV